MTNCEDCKLEDRVKALEADSKRNSDAHQKFYDGLKELEKHDVKTDTCYSTILTTMAEMKSAIEEMKSKPAKRWETVITAIITGAVAFVLGLVLRGGV